MAIAYRLTSAAENDFIEILDYTTREGISQAEKYAAEIEGCLQAIVASPGRAKALRKLMADKDLRVNLGESEQQRFEERFHPDRVMGEILEVYGEAIERAKERRRIIGNHQSHQ